MTWLVACAAALAMSGVSAQSYPTKTHVTSLPGWTDEQGNPAPLPSDMYTGYLNAGTPPSGQGDMYFHYWLIESESDPANDPIMFWYNGGPGASSLFGLLQEFGPLLLNDQSYDDKYNQTGIPTPQSNPFAWTKTHNIVALDSPPPIGLSFCTEGGPAGAPTSCGPWKDTDVFAANHNAHKAFFEVFPAFKPNPMYFIGESYAGIYVPGFVNAMLDDPVGNLQGFAVGDGWTGCRAKPDAEVDWCIDLDNVGVFKYPNVFPGPYYDVEYFHGHSQYSEALYRDIWATCSLPELRGDKPMATGCAGLIDEMTVQVGYWYPYNLYNACPGSDAAVNKHGMNRALDVRRKMAAIVSGKTDYSGLSSPCLGNVMNEWLLRNDTLTALGAPLDSAFINLDNGHGFSYTSNQPFVGPIYEKAIKAGLKVMVYEGDTDACGLQTAQVEDIFEPLFTEEFKLNKTQVWRPWTLDGEQQQAGFNMVWNHGDVQFVSVRGSGHLLPLNRPRAAFTMVNALTSNTPLPPYKPAY